MELLPTLTVRRCQATSPISSSTVFPPVQCTKPDVHNRTEQEVTHQHGARAWVERRSNTDSVSSTPDLKEAGENLLAGIKANFESMDRVEAEIELRDWWIGKAASEIELTVPKAVEYGSTDLIDIGLMLARTMRRTVDEAEAAELGVFFYLIGKIARWQSAIERGERPSDDTLLDIGVYVRMAQRIRDAGGWPGTSQPQCNHLGGHLPNCDRDEEDHGYGT